MFHRDWETGPKQSRRGGRALIRAGILPALIAAALSGPTAAAGVAPHHSVYRIGDQAALPGPNADVVDILLLDGRFDTFVLALQTAGLTQVLRGPGPFFLDAPTDEAFAQLPQESVDRLLADRHRLFRMLARHVSLGNKTPSGAVPPLTRRVAIDPLIGQGLDNGRAIRAGNGVVRASSAVRLSD